MFLLANKAVASFHTSLSEAIDVASGGKGFSVWKLEDIRRIAMGRDGLMLYHSRDASPVWKQEP